MNTTAAAAAANRKTRPSLAAAVVSPARLRRVRRFRRAVCKLRALGLAGSGSVVVRGVLGRFEAGMLFDAVGRLRPVVRSPQAPPARQAGASPLATPRSRPVDRVVRLPYSPEYVTRRFPAVRADRRRDARPFGSDRHVSASTLGSGCKGDRGDGGAA